MNKDRINHLNSVWLTANAGSGKTTALTHRVVSLLLRGVVPEHICCITYTKAAASEMQMRVLASLRKLLLLDDADCATEVERLLGKAPSAEEMYRARHLFGQVLDSPLGGVQLTTIHGFCQNILRRFPIEAGVAPHFTVLEDSAADTLLAQAKHRLLSNIASGDRWLTEALALFGERSGETRFDTIMRAIIQKRTTWQKIWNFQTADLLRSHIFSLHELRSDVTQNALNAALLNCMNADDELVIRQHLSQLLSHKNSGEQQMGWVLSQWLSVDVAERAGLIDDFCKIFITTEYTKRARLLNAKEFPDHAPLRHVVERLADAVLTYSNARLSLAAAEESFAIAVLARDLLKLYEQAKQSMQVLDYEDLIARTRQLFSQSENLGWVMSKLDHRIDHLLIDEAQDTSADQWHIAQSLVEELVAANAGLGSGNQPRSLLVVGDEKQSIYSFSGAAPELFASKEAEFKTMLEHSAAPMEVQVLDTSYRSAEAVLKLVNHVAAQPDVAVALSAAGVSPPHKLHRVQATGRVVFYPPLTAPEKITLTPLTIPTEYQIVRSGPQMLAEQVAEAIAGWMEQKRWLASEGRPVQAGDILVLVHRRKPIVLPLIRALERKNIPVAGLDRLTLADHLAVKDLLALMRWCMHVDDDLALAQVLRSPLIGISDEALRGFAHGRAGSLWHELQSSDHAALLRHWLHQRHAMPYEFLTEVLEVAGARKRFATRFGEEVHEVLDELKEQAATMPENMQKTLTHFADWVGGSRRQIKREQEAGAVNQVRIMTVHGAKGLEAPIVLMVDTDSVPDTRREVVYFSMSAQGQTLPVVALSEEAKYAPLLLAAKEKKNEQLVNEYQRLLYVALTRAREELHVFGMVSKKGEAKTGSWYETIRRSMKDLNAVEEGDELVLRDVRSASAAKATAQHENKLAPLPPWAKNNPRTIEVTPAVRSSSQLGAGQVPAYVVASGQNMRERGVRIHRVLQMLHKETDENYISKLVRYVAPDWNLDEQKKAIIEIHALFNQHQFLWQHLAHAEVNIAGTIDMAGIKTPISGQIDLLVETPTEMIVLDYKTGRHVPTSAAEVSENYRLQLKTYQALLRQIHPQKPVRVAILWTSVPQLMWLDAAVENTLWNLAVAA